MPRAPPWKEKQSQYLQRCSDRMLSPKTIKTYRAALLYVYRYAVATGWPLNPQKVEPHHIRDLYYHMVDLGISSGSQKVYMMVLMNFLEFCKNKQVEDVELKIKVSRTRVNWMTELEVATVLQASHIPAQRGILVLMAYCGLRLGEVADLRVRDVSLNQLTVRGKCRKERTIPLDRPFWAAMRPYTDWASLRPRTDFFISYQHLNGKMYGYTPEGIGVGIADLSHRMGMTFSAHTLRRSFGRHLYKHGCPLAELQVLMGHSTMEMTVRYLGIGNEDITHAMGFRPDYLEKID